MIEEIKQDTNTGDRNTGDRNTGNRNTGNRNTGNWNTGNRNTGNWNTGNWNTGNWNTGNCNAGDWNTGNRNTGYCNTITPEYTLIFNKTAKFTDWENAAKPNWIYFILTEWIYSNDMTQTEKELYPTHETTGGYLRKYEFKQAALKSWNETTHEDRMKTYLLPNFDADVAEKIFGIDFKWYLSKNTNEIQIQKLIEPEIITLNGKRYQLIEDDNE